MCLIKKEKAMTGIEFYRRKSFKEKDLYTIFESFTKKHPSAQKIFHTLRTSQQRAFPVHNWGEVLKSIAFVHECEDVSEERKIAATVALLFKDIIYLNNLSDSTALSAKYAQEVLINFGVFSSNPQKVFEIRNAIKNSTDEFRAPFTDLDKLICDAQTIALASTKYSFDSLMGNLAIENGFTQNALSFHQQNSKKLQELFLSHDLELYPESLPQIFFTNEGKKYNLAAIDNLKRYADDDWYRKHY